MTQRSRRSQPLVAAWLIGVVGSGLLMYGADRYLFGKDTSSVLGGNVVIAVLLGSFMGLWLRSRARDGVRRRDRGIREGATDVVARAKTQPADGDALSGPGGDSP